jgi:hypothetical protein
MSNLEEKVVKLSDYNKLKFNYDRLKKRNDKMITENRNLKEMVENMIKNYETIKESRKTSENLILEIQKKFHSLTSVQHKSKEEYSTTTSCIEYISSVKRCNSKQEKTEQISNISLYLKKLDEMESNYQEICKSFYNTVKKYKFIKQDYDVVNDNNIKLLQQIHLMNNEMNILLNEVNEKQSTIERFKEIDKCLVDSTISTMVLNTNEQRKSIKEEQCKSNRNVPYVVCEPIPSFLKFINKTY